MLFRSPDEPDEPEEPEEPDEPKEPDEPDDPPQLTDSAWDHHCVNWTVPKHKQKQKPKSPWEPKSGHDSD